MTNVGRRIVSAVARIRATAPVILQLALTVTLSFSVSHFGLGHASPALACTVALSSLSLNRDARPRRVAETASAMVLGITLSATIVTVLGRGPGQVAATVLVVLTIATAISRNPAFALSAGTQSMLVAVLPDPAGGPYMRAVDGAIGGLSALLITAMWPNPALRHALTAGDKALRELVACTQLIVGALDDADPLPARSAVERLTLAGKLMETWTIALTSAREVAAFSPTSRRRRQEWSDRTTLQRGATRLQVDLQMVARRAAVLSSSGRPQRRTASVVSTIARGLAGLPISYMDSRASKDPAPFLEAAERIGELSARSSVDQGILAMLRQVVVDALLAVGHSDQSARASLPPAEVPPPTTSIVLPNTR